MKSKSTYLVLLVLRLEGLSLIPGCFIHSVVTPFIICRMGVINL